MYQGEREMHQKNESIDQGKCIKGTFFRPPYAPGLFPWSFFGQLCCATIAGPSCGNLEIFSKKDGLSSRLLYSYDFLCRIKKRISLLIKPLLDYIDIFPIRDQYLWWKHLKLGQWQKKILNLEGSFSTSIKQGSLNEECKMRNEKGKRITRNVRRGM